MHNCKATRERVAELLLENPEDRADEPSWAELGGCADCRAKVETLKETLRICKRVIEAASPAEIYWAGYHARLKEKLEGVGLGESFYRHDQMQAMLLPGTTKWLVRFLKSSVRVPVPVGLALILVTALALRFGNLASQTVPAPPIVSVVQIPVEVPVIQEKTVTKTVYRERVRRVVLRELKQTSSAAEGDSVVAASQKPKATTLVGFKPLDEVKLTVIKGGSPDEK